MSARVPRGPRPVGDTCAGARDPGPRAVVQLRFSAARPSPGRGDRPMAISPAVKSSGLPQLEASGPRVAWRAAAGRKPDATRSFGRGSHSWGAGIPRVVGQGWVRVSMAERAPSMGRGRADPLLAANSNPISSAYGLKWHPPTHPPRSPKLRWGVERAADGGGWRGGSSHSRLPPKSLPEPEERLAARVSRTFLASAQPC